MTAAAEKVPAGSERLMSAPYLMGERTPHLDPYVRAAFAGIFDDPYRGALYEGGAGGRGLLTEGFVHAVYGTGDSASDGGSEAGVREGRCGERSRPACMG